MRIISGLGFLMLLGGGACAGSESMEGIMIALAVSITGALLMWLGETLEKRRRRRRNRRVRYI